MAGRVVYCCLSELWVAIVVSFCLGCWFCFLGVGCCIWCGVIGWYSGAVGLWCFWSLVGPWSYMVPGAESSYKTVGPWSCLSLELLVSGTGLLSSALRFGGVVRLCFLCDVF